MSGCAMPCCLCCTTAQLLDKYRAGVVMRFDPKASGHKATNYQHWFATRKAYPVPYQRRYEPWVIAHRATVPL